MKASAAPELTIDRLIASSGIVGRQILRLYQSMHEGDDGAPARGAVLARLWPRQRRLHQLLSVAGISWLVEILYTYYVGGSLTRSDQLTFAKIHGMGESAHRLTVVNALVCGIPCGLGYFLLGEGFCLLSRVHSYAELPALFAQHTSLGIGLTSLTVDIFRAVDALWHRRCWAPFGFVPLAINLPTYLKRLAQKAGCERTAMSECGDKASR